MHKPSECVMRMSTRTVKNRVRRNRNAVQAMILSRKRLRIFKCHVHARGFQIQQFMESSVSRKCRLECSELGVPIRASVHETSCFQLAPVTGGSIDCRFRCPYVDIVRWQRCVPLFRPPRCRCRSDSCRLFAADVFLRGQCFPGRMLMTLLNSCWLADEVR